MANPAPETVTNPAGTPLLRALRPGDYGWIIGRHGEIYAREYGWDISFEGLVAGICAQFLAGHDPARERGWMAELDGRPVGSVHCMKLDDETAKLRMLIVAPEARGHGVGGMLVDACMAFARDAGYHRMTLWTNDILIAARKIYLARGWRMIAGEPVNQFGQAMVSETWEVEL